MRRALIEFAERHGLVILADEVYGDLGYDGPVPPMGSLDSGRADHLVLEPVEGVSRAGLARRLDGGRARRRASTTCSAAIKKLADGRLCSPGPMQYAVAPALTGDRRTRSRSARRCGARAELTVRALNAIPGMTCVAPRGRVLRDAAGRAAAGRDRRATTCSRCCARPACCASTARASACRPEDGFFRIVFLARPTELADDLRRHRRVHPQLSARVTASGSISAPHRRMVDRHGRRRALLAVALYQARNALLLVYVSALLAMGISPIVRAVERQKLLPVGTRTFHGGSRSSRRR